MYLQDPKYNSRGKVDYQTDSFLLYGQVVLSVDCYCDGTTYKDFIVKLASFKMTRSLCCLLYSHFCIKRLFESANSIEGNIL